MAQKPVMHRGDWTGYLSSDFPLPIAGKVIELLVPET